MITETFICLNCRHFTPITGGCRAFPDGIPMEISDDGQPHSQPLPGQKNKIVYEPLQDGESWANPATWPKTKV